MVGHSSSQHWLSPYHVSRVILEHSEGRPGWPVGAKGLKDLVLPAGIPARPLPCALISGGYTSSMTHDPILRATLP